MIPLKSRSQKTEPVREALAAARVVVAARTAGAFHPGRQPPHVSLEGRESPRRRPHHAAPDGGPNGHADGHRRFEVLDDDDDDDRDGDDGGNGGAGEDGLEVDHGGRAECSGRSRRDQGCSRCATRATFTDDRGVPRILQGDPCSCGSGRKQAQASADTPRQRNGSVNSCRTDSSAGGGKRAGGSAAGNLHASFSPTALVHEDRIGCVAAGVQRHLRRVGSRFVASQHQRKLRTLLINPNDCTECATSALDGRVKLWKIRGRGEHVELRHSINCETPKRSFPQDLAWRPDGAALVAVYNAAPGDWQAAVVTNSPKCEGARKLEGAPHDKGIINRVAFLPWGDGRLFATGGCDHAVVLWECSRQASQPVPRLLHRHAHTSAVTDVDGMPRRGVVVSAGLDKRVIGWDVEHGQQAFKLTFNSKAIACRPNALDANLLLVQIGTLGQQLRLWDARSPRELHWFGFEQATSDEQSGLIKASWSPCGRLVAVGSPDPQIHVFDIRQLGRSPALSIDAHQKRVVRAVWHPTLPLLMSISSDLTIGLHELRP
eukprot:SM000433S15731  [mRNA]  locus=s433:17209:24330:- [translate_table: standard]